MVRTMSAMLRRSFARIQAVGLWSQAVGRDQREFRAIPSLFVTVSLVQSTLVVGLGLIFATAAIDQSAVAAQFIGGVAVLMAVFTGYLVMWCPHTVRAPGRDAPLADSDGQLDDLRARVSHELRTPLNAVVGFADMMNREMLGPVGNERYREYAGHIARSAERFQAATEKTLAVTELLTAQPNQVRSSIKLSDAVYGSLADFRSVTCSFKPNWEIEVGDDAHVMASPALLHDALYHLWDAGRLLAAAYKIAEARVSSQRQRDGQIRLTLTLVGCDPTLAMTDPEGAPGSELSVLLAKLSIEAAGGKLDLGQSDAQSWTATVHLPDARPTRLKK